MGRRIGADVYQRPDPDTDCPEVKIGPLTVMRGGLLPDNELVYDEWTDALKAAMVLTYRAQEVGEPFPPAELFPSEIRALDTWDGVMGNLMAMASRLWRWKQEKTR